MHVLVLGAGAIGGLVASRLSRKESLRVTVAVRRPTPPLAFFEEVNGHVLESHPAVRIADDPTSVGAADWVVVASKAHDVPSLAGWLQSPAVRDSRIAVAQNGIEHRERLASFAPPERVLPAIVTYGAERTAPGVVRQTLSGRVRVLDDDLGVAFADLADGSGLDVELVPAFDLALWTKLAYNLVGNSISTIADVPVNRIGRRAELRFIAERLVDECAALARTRGVHLPEGLATTMLDEFAAFPDTVHSSMWQDRHASRPYEYDAISGTVARLSDAAALPAPYATMTTHLLKTFSPG